MQTETSAMHTISDAGTQARHAWVSDLLQELVREARARPEASPEAICKPIMHTIEAGWMFTLGRCRNEAQIETLKQFK